MLAEPGVGARQELARALRTGEGLVEPAEGRGTGEGPRTWQAGLRSLAGRLRDMLACFCWSLRTSNAILEACRASSICTDLY